MDYKVGDFAFIKQTDRSNVVYFGRVLQLSHADIKVGVWGAQGIDPASALYAQVYSEKKVVSTKGKKKGRKKCETEPAVYLSKPQGKKDSPTVAHVD